MQDLIGILGGTFDPFHKGHLHVAIQLLSKFPFKQIRILPCFEPVHRVQPVAKAEQRLEMCKLGVENQEKLIVDEREIKRQGPSYMIDTLKSLREEFPTEPLLLIIGMDSFAGFTSWKNWEKIPEFAHLLIVNRPNVTLSSNKKLTSFTTSRLTTNIEDLKKQPNGLIYVAEIPPSPVSATTLRERASNKEDISDFVTSEVLQYILTHHIY